MKKEVTKRHQRLQHNQESRTASLFFYDPDLQSSYNTSTFLSSFCYLEFKKAEPRFWNASKYTREYEYSWKRLWLTHVQRDPEELHNYFRKLAAPSGIADDVEDSEKMELRIVGAKNHYNQ